MDTADKVRENRIRRMAARQGVKLEKARRYDPLALDFGTYQLVRVAGNARLASRFLNFALTLDQVEKILTEGKL